VLDWVLGPILLRCGTCVAIIALCEEFVFLIEMAAPGWDRTSDHVTRSHLQGGSKKTGLGQIGRGRPRSAVIHISPYPPGRHRG